MCIFKNVLYIYIYLCCYANTLLTNQMLIYTFSIWVNVEFWPIVISSLFNSKLKLLFHIHFEGRYFLCSLFFNLDSAAIFSASLCVCVCFKHFLNPAKLKGFHYTFDCSFMLRGHNGQRVSFKGKRIKATLMRNSLIWCRADGRAWTEVFM